MVVVVDVSLSSPSIAVPVSAVLAAAAPAAAIVFGISDAGLTCCVSVSILSVINCSNLRFNIGTLDGPHGKLS